MRAQKPATTAQRLIQQHRYDEAVVAAAQDPLHRAEALKLLGRFDDAIAAYRQSDDPAAREGIALSLAHLGRDLDEAKRLMEETIALHPQIQEFQALGLAYILLNAASATTPCASTATTSSCSRPASATTTPIPIRSSPRRSGCSPTLADASGDAPPPAKMLRDRAATGPPQNSVWAMWLR